MKHSNYTTTVGICWNFLIFQVLKWLEFISISEKRFWQPLSRCVVIVEMMIPYVRLHDGHHGFSMSSAKCDDCLPAPGTPKLDKKQRANLQEMQTAEVIELIIAAGQSSLWGKWVTEVGTEKHGPRTIILLISRISL